MTTVSYQVPGPSRSDRRNPVPNLGPSELLIVLVILIVLFGGSKLPQLARSLGTARKEFEKGQAMGLPDDSSTAAEVR